MPAYAREPSGTTVDELCGQPEQKYGVRSTVRRGCASARSLASMIAMRAAIRAKVTAARAAVAPAGDRGAITRSATAYFALAIALIAPPPPRLIAVGGLSGTGKSLLARIAGGAEGPWVVRVGHYADRAAAEREQARLRDEEKLQPFIVKR